MDKAVQIAAIVKKVLEVLASNEKGRNFLLYVVGIAIFLLLLPIIVIFGLFGWMSGSGGPVTFPDDILNQLPEDDAAIIEQMNVTCDTIRAVFDIKGLTENDEGKAEMIYLSYLVGMESKDFFFDNLANCFLFTTAYRDVYDLVYDTFFVVISEEDQTQMDQLYGVTPIRVIE